MRYAGGAAMMLAVLVGGCATPPSDPAELAVYEQNNDPLEPLNRKILVLNLALDHAVIRPLAKAYVFIVPEDGRTAVHNVLNNLKEPTVFFDNVLQGEFKRAGITLGRFAMNSTVGLAGIFDIATRNGMERQPADFGQTLYVWGIKSGPYLILPVFGPSNPRDAIGQGVDSYADPFTIWANDHGVTELTTARLLVGGVDDRAAVLDILDDLEKNSVDFYAQLRSLAQQNRAAELNHGTAPAATPNLYNDPGTPAPTPAPAVSPAPPPATKPSSLTPSRQIASRVNANLFGTR
ncbi:MAG TPA: VacJ family lipoprotein [Stellaceae bacterium]|nr:VacJ family lipoprotein [Stellaceae bacterium]